MDRELQEQAEAAARGDRAALHGLIERYLPDLRAYVRLKAGPTVRAHESSSDLVQSVCREVLQHRARFRFPSEQAFKHWLFTTALRKILNRRDHWHAERRDARREVPLDARGPDASGDGALLASYSGVVTPSRHAMAREELARVEGAFDRLPDEYREVIVLAHVVGLSRAEIGERMGRSEAAVRVLLHRALARLSGLVGRPDEGASGHATT